MKKLCCTLLVCCLFLLLQAQEATNDDCYENFFQQAEKIKNTSSIKLLLKNNKETTLKSFLKANYIETNFSMGLKDLDADGSRELVIQNFTGGAHCCDEFYFFKKNASQKYALTAKLFAGNTCVDRNNLFTFDLYESFGYFFTCYACSLDNSDNGGRESATENVYQLKLKYKDGKLQVQPGKADLLKQIKQNLAYIKSLGWDGGVKEDDFDDGRRKELALNLATYYFSFGKNLVETQKLFAAYYPFKDAAKVWKAFLAGLNQVKATNDF